MNSNPKFIRGGGWVNRETIGRPRARRFGFLTLVGLYVLVLLWNTPLHLLCYLLMLPLFFVAISAFFCLLYEQPRPINEEIPNPNHDSNNLY